MPVIDISAPESQSTGRGERFFPSRGAAVDVTDGLADLIADCLGSANPSTSTRTARYGIRLGPGSHFVSGDASRSPIEIKSAMGLSFLGSGMEATKIVASGESMPAVLDLNGLSRSKVGGFTISAPNTTTCNTGVWLRWGTGISRSTNYDVLEDIAVENLKFKEGIKLGEETRDNQVDTAKLYNCVVKGQWTPGETTWWQAALAVGHNVFANNLNHTGYGLSMANCARGIDMRRSQFALYGGEMGGNGADVYVTGNTHYLTVTGVRSEGSARLLDGTGLSVGSIISLSDYNFRANQLHADERLMKVFSGGTLMLDRISVLALTSTAVRPKIYLRPEAPLHVIMNAHQCPTPVEEWFEIDQTLAAVSIGGQGWDETNSSGQPQRLIPFVMSRNGVPYEVSVNGSGNVVGTAIAAD